MKNKFSIIKDNLKLARISLSLANTITEGQIDELVRLFDGEQMEHSVAADVFTRVFGSSLLSEDFFNFCIKLSEQGCLTSDIDKDKYVKAEAAVCSYLDNAYSREALEMFGKHINIYPDAENDFNSVCESVYSGRNKYAVIPLFNTRDGLMISLYKLLHKYDLKIVASTKVLMNDGNTETEFFLVSRHITNADFCDNIRLMLSVTHPYDNTSVKLMNAAGNSGIILCSVNTMPLEYTDERCESVLIFDISFCKTEAVCCFLHAAVPDANIIGIYPIVK